MNKTTSVWLDDLMPLIKERLLSGESVCFTPRGISMRPMLEGGRDQVILSPMPQKLKKYDLPLYQRDNGQYVLHRVVRAGDRYTCIGDNQFALEHGLRHEQMIAVVTGFVRKGKTYSVDSAGYNLYCRLWHFSRPIRRVFVVVINKMRAVIRRIHKKKTDKK